MKKTDAQLKSDVEEELRWDPRINAAHIGVSVDQGAVSLFGSVETYAERWAAEAATKRVSGVCAIAQELTVKLASDHVRDDTDIASAIQNALEWDVFVPRGILAKVESGSVTLEGKVSWNYQRDAAESACRRLVGVLSVTNAITIEPQASVAEVKQKVEAALKRQAATDTKSIQVETVGGRVTLSGTASSWQSIEDAAAAAWERPA